MQKARLLIFAFVAVLLLGACGLELPGDTSKITLVSSTTSGVWKYDFYRNNAYPCAISGYQTFVVGTKVGSSATTPGPLWAFMHGGGAGYFDDQGNPVPGPGQKTEEDATSLTSMLKNNALIAL